MQPPRTLVYFRAAFEQERLDCRTERTDQDYGLDKTLLRITEMARVELACTECRSYVFATVSH